MLWPRPNNGVIEIISSLPTVVLAFSFHFNTFPIYFTLKARTNKEMLYSTTVAITISFVFYFGVGLLGYVMYDLSGVESIMTVNLQKDLDKMKSDSSTRNGFMFYFYLIGLIAFMISCVLTVPIVFVATKKHFINLVLFIKRKKQKLTSSKLTVSTFGKIILTLFLYGGVLLVTLTVKNIMMLFNFIGSTSSSAISFILPGSFLVILLKKTGIRDGFICAILVLILGFIGILSFYIPEIIKLFI